MAVNVSGQGIACSAVSCGYEECWRVC